MALSARVSLAAQRTIREAFQDLERTVSEKDRAGLTSTTLDNVIKAAHDIEDQLAARQLLRNMRRLEPLFTGLQYYCKSIEVLCDGTPYLPWVWAPIKLILKVASDFIDAFEKIIAAYARIAEPLARFKLFDQAYSTNVEIQQTLAIFYSDILKFHKHVYKFVRRSGWKIFFMTSWGRFERRFDGLIDDLRSHGDLVDRTANTVNVSESQKMRGEWRKMREEVSTLRRETLERAAKDEDERTSNQYIAIVGWLKMDDSEQAKLFESVTTEPQKYAGTCDWILRQDKIVAWMRCSQESAFLVLHGNPGTGKSVLATSITAFLRSAEKSLVVSHICTYSQPNSTEYDQLLRSILLQLVRADVDLIAYIYAEFILKKKSVTSQAIERLILETVGAISNNPAETKYVHIVLDGLDECEKEKQPRVINLLERMVSAGSASSSAVCKVLLTTCMPPTIAKKLKQKHMVSLSGEKEALGGAIKLYASHRLGQLRSRWHQMGITDVDIKDLETRLTTKADGMFLWARLVLEYLSTNMFVRKSEVLSAVETLPRELSEFYGQILAQLVSHFDNRSVSRLRSILGWVAFARRPLRKAELRSALSVPEEDDVHVQEMAPNYLFEMCSPLIEERSDSTFSFVHISVKEFLQSSDSKMGLDEQSAVYEQGYVVASCLLSGLEVFQPGYDDNDRSLRVLRGFHGLHVYASEFWIEYLLSIAACNNGLDHESAFFDRSIQLSRHLNSLPRAEYLSSNPSTEDDRLVYLGGQPELLDTAQRILAERRMRIERSTSTSPPEPRQPAIDTALCEVTDLPTLLANYQHTVRALLVRPWNYPGVKVQELERFKQDFRFTAFTCRFPGCPFCSLGFANEDLQHQHEQAHVPQVTCEAPECRQYPPFPSVQALKNHKMKYHSRGVVMSTKKIRIPENFVRRGAVVQNAGSGGKRLVTGASETTVLPVAEPPAAETPTAPTAPTAPTTPPPQKPTTPASAKLATSCWNRLIAWSKAGTIASSDGITLQFRFLRAHPADGSWGLSEPTTCAEVAGSLSSPIQHLSWSNTSPPLLAVIDSIGRVAFLRFDTSLNAPRVLQTFEQDSSSTAFGRMVGCFWLEPAHLSQETPKSENQWKVARRVNVVFGPATKQNDGSYNYGKSYTQDTGPWHHDPWKSVFIGVTENGTVRTLHCNDDRVVDEQRTTLQLFWQLALHNRLAHASMCTLELETPRFSMKQRSFSRFFSGPHFPNSLRIKVVGTITGVEIIVPAITVNQEFGVEGTVGMSIAVVSDLETTEQHPPGEKTRINRWNVHFKNHPAEATPDTIREANSVFLGSRLIGIESDRLRKSFCLAFEHGAAAYLDCNTWVPSYSFPGPEFNQVTTLETAGMSWPPSSAHETALVSQLALSPTKCSKVFLRKDGSVEWIQPYVLDSPFPEVLSARIAALTLAVSSAATFEAHIDDILALARVINSHSNSKEFLSRWLNEIINLLEIRTDYIESAEPEELMLNTGLQLCFSIMNHLGFSGEQAERSLESKVAGLALNCRNAIKSIQAARKLRLLDPERMLWQDAQTPLLHDHEVVSTIDGYVSWAVKFFDWLTKTFYDFSQQSVSLLRRDLGGLATFLVSQEALCLVLLTCSSTRCFVWTLYREISGLSEDIYKVIEVATPNYYLKFTASSMLNNIEKAKVNLDASKKNLMSLEIQLAGLPRATQESLSKVLPSNPLMQSTLFAVLPQFLASLKDPGLAPSFPAPPSTMGSEKPHPIESISSRHPKDINPLSVGVEVCGIHDMSLGWVGKRWRRCTRCTDVMEDRNAGESEGLKIILAQLARCPCGGYWGLLPQGKFVS